MPTVISSDFLLLLSSSSLVTQAARAAPHGKAATKKTSHRVLFSARARAYNREDKTSFFFSLKVQ
jgi:hypothetical protein